MFSVHGQLGDVLEALADEMKAAGIEEREVGALVVLASRVRRKRVLNQYEVSLRSLEPYQPDVEEEE